MSPLRPAQRRSARLREHARQPFTMSNTIPTPLIPSQGPQVKTGASWQGMARGTARGTARGSTARGQGGSRGKAPVHQPVHGTPAEDSPSPSSGNVNWENNPTLTTNLIQWLVDCPADRHILFHDRATSTYIPSSGDKPSSRNKKEVLAVVAAYLFEKDPAYGSAYALDKPKLSSSLTNRLAT